jgi:hypothetical protein
MRTFESDVADPPRELIYALLKWVDENFTRMGKAIAYLQAIAEGESND